MPNGWLADLVLKYERSADGLSFIASAPPKELSPIYTNATYKTKGWERGPFLNGTFVQFNLPGTFTTDFILTTYVECRH